jgi:hypothetical protein
MAFYNLTSYLFDLCTDRPEFGNVFTDITITGNIIRYLSPTITYYINNFWLLKIPNSDKNCN